MTDDTDAALVARVRLGSRRAAGQLAERYLRACRAVALSITGSIDAAEDIAQDAFVYAIDRIDDCRKPDRFGSWLLQIVRNKSRNHIRDAKADTHVELDERTLHSDDRAPDHAAEMMMLRARLLSALGTLPEDRREVVLLHDLEGWTHREIAERMDLPPGTVRSHLHHARRAMREMLRGWLERNQ